MISLFIVFLFLLACNEHDEQPPPGILSKEKMITVLIDIYLTESAISLKNITRDSSVALYSLYEKEIFKKHNISDSVFYRSREFYYNHPKMYYSIYESLVDSLSMRQARRRL
ncbi:MAG: DUF4296 domain-containing protein [Cytophagaceae bacterium]|nr:DUF4296 domain-containing protein [Cytophagaceae bacterium]MDW8456972.1 DUF4296 domain-containing protein [Cytophagaceae bacterium]